MRLAVMLGVVLMTIGVCAAVPSFNPSPWVADLDQVHHTISTKYANLEWAVFQREGDLPALFADAQARIERASSDAEARAAFDRLANKLGDEHVEFVWPKHGVASQPQSVDECTALGFDQRSRAKPLVSFVPGYRAISAPQSDDFPIGSLNVGKDAVGVIQIGVFEPQGFPTLCQLALHALSVPPNKPCDDACSDRVDSWVSDRLTRDFANQLRSLKSAGAKVLLVDIAGNGGGTEWAEAVARMLTPIRLRSESLHFMRGDH